MLDHIVDGFAVEEANFLLKIFILVVKKLIVENDAINTVFSNPLGKRQIRDICIFGKHELNSFLMIPII